MEKQQRESFHEKWGNRVMITKHMGPQSLQDQNNRGNKRNVSDRFDKFIPFLFNRAAHLVIKFPHQGISLVNKACKNSIYPLLSDQAPREKSQG
jgi:hypothetical protein